MKPLASYRLHNQSETGHIGDIELVKRLLQGYDYQLKHFKENTLFDQADLKYFRYWKWKYFRRVIGYGLRYLSYKEIAYALNYL